MVCFQSILCGEASTSRLPGINPAGYVSQTGYQYDSISRVAGHRELAPPSKFSKLGGFNSKVFITSGTLHLPTPQKRSILNCSEYSTNSETANFRQPCCEKPVFAQFWYRIDIPLDV